MTYVLKEAVSLYKSVGSQNRNITFLANWIYKVSHFFSFSEVDDSYKKRLPENKTKLTIFGILVDDLADNYKLRNKTDLEKAIQIPFNINNKYRKGYLKVTRKIWKDIKKSIEQYPRYKEFKDLFVFDLEQFFDSIRYSFLINTLGIDNFLEHKIYPPHNMMSLLFFDMDLMCFTNFNKKELKRLRPILYWAQDIVHIGNVINTYPREIKERDFSSPIISLGLRKGLITKNDITENPEDCTKKLKVLITHFKERAEKDFSKIRGQKDRIESIDVKEFSERVRKAYNKFLERGKYWR